MPKNKDSLPAVFETITVHPKRSPIQFAFPVGVELASRRLTTPAPHVIFEMLWHFVANHAGVTE